MSETFSLRILRLLRLDPLLMLLILLLMALSLVVLYSTGGGDVALVGRQLIRFGVALLVMLLVAQVRVSLLKIYSPVLYILALFLLLLVMLFGATSMGATRWLDLGFFRFQPSEVMKLFAPMMVAWYLANRSLPPRFVHVLVCLCLMAMPMVLIIEQPDLGTAILVGSAAFFVVFLAGIAWRLLALGALLMSVIAPAMWFYVMEDYQKRRVLTFLDPERDPLNSGYHIIQSKIAIGSGGIYGKGWLEGTQSQLDFLPEQTTDFIFAVLGEEFGFIGVFLLLVLYMLVVWRTMVIARDACDKYSRLLAGSISLTFFVYVFVNIGMVSGVLPVVGVPLPLISYGGTSIVTLLAGFGMLMSIFSTKTLIAR